MAKKTIAAWLKSISKEITITLVIVVNLALLGFCPYVWGLLWYGAGAFYLLYMIGQEIWDVLPSKWTGEEETSCDNEWGM
jgi:hypothetical protein